ncbi:MAG: hypothetical protein J6N52_11890 [Clostridia bacterium]|nr:hypothetical protein [Clostridia bacterium]
MNYLWGGLIIISFIFAAINGRIDETVAAGFDGAKSGIEIVLSFAGIMCLWNGLLKGAKDSGLCTLIKKALMPVIGRLFPRLDRESDAVNYITLNITANLLGTGNGATPMGINAMKELAKSCGGKPSEEMCLFTVMNTAAFQLIPSSIIALRSANGSANPFDIVAPIWICSFFSLLIAVLCVKIMFLFIKNKKISREGGL